MESVRKIPVGSGEYIALVDLPALDPSSRHGTVVLVPPFAMQAYDLFPAAFVLAMNGFDVVRLDGRNSLGLGSGTIGSYQLSTVTEDIIATCQALAGDRGTEHPVIAVGLSLSTRPLMRAARDLKVSGVVCFTPVVNVRHTLSCVIGKDYFAYEEGNLPDQELVLGHFLPKSFILDAAAGGYVDLVGAVADARSSRVPIDFLAGDEDPWVALEDVGVCARAASGDGSLMVVGASSHELNRSPRLAMAYLKELSRLCLLRAGVTDSVPKVPPFSEIIKSRGKYRVSSEVRECL